MTKLTLTGDTWVNCFEDNFWKNNSQCCSVMNWIDFKISMLGFRVGINSMGYMTNEAKIIPWTGGWEVPTMEDMEHSWRNLLWFHNTALEMAVDQSASPVLSNAFLHNCVSKLEDGGTEENTKSPHLSRRSLNELESSEKSGIPLNTAWTLWHDKSVFFANNIFMLSLYNVPLLKR